MGVLMIFRSWHQLYQFCIPLERLMLKRVELLV